MGRMVKRFIAVAILFLLYLLLTFPAQAGVLRDLAHAGKQIGAQTCKMVHNVGRDLLRWIY